jgi:hypothetical protein
MMEFELEVGKQVSLEEKADRTCCVEFHPSNILKNRVRLRDEAPQQMVRTYSRPSRSFGGSSQQLGLVPPPPKDKDEDPKAKLQSEMQVKVMNTGDFEDVPYEFDSDVLAALTDKDHTDGNGQWTENGNGHTNGKSTSPRFAGKSERKVENAEFVLLTPRKGASTPRRVIAAPKTPPRKSEDGSKTPPTSTTPRMLAYGDIPVQQEDDPQEPILNFERPVQPLTPRRPAQ